MRISIQSLLIFSLAVGLTIINALACQDGSAEKILGKWNADKDLSLKHSKDSGDDHSAQIEGMPESIVIELTKDGAATSWVNDTQMDGKWELVEQKSPTEWSLKLIRGDRSVPTQVVLKEDGSLMISPEGEFPLVFVRAKSSGLEGKLIGTWKGDGEASKKLDANAKFDAADIDGMVEQIKNLELAFKEGGEFQMTMAMGDEAPMAINGHWTVHSEDAKTNTLTATLELEGSETGFTFKFLDDDKIQAAPEGEPAAVLVRNPKKSSDK